MYIKMGIKKLQKENEKLRSNIKKLLSTYMMSDEVDDAEILINELIENEIEQESLCTG